VPDKRDYWKLITGETFEETTRIPTLEDTLNQQWKEIQSKYPLRMMGQGKDGSLLLSEEEREDHLHILGTTGEGKSRFIEHLIRGDIQNGNGVCFLDPTDRADTAYRILRYCAKIGFKKVCLIDPHTLQSHGKITAIQPFHRDKSYKQATVSNLMDTVRVLFHTKDASETPQIQVLLPALFHVLWNAGMTLHEAVYFTNYKMAARRREILFYSSLYDRHRLNIEEAFTNFALYKKEFGSTLRRMEPFFDSTLDLMYGAYKGVNFAKMITEGWVILVNLHSGLGFEPIHTRLLGTSVINEIIFALDRLRSRGWKGVYYLYIDEAGEYANRNLAHLLAYKRKSGLRVTIAHQFFAQFEDKTVLNAVKQLCKTKVMFNTPDHTDRLEMVKALGYGGDIPPLMASYANSNLPKQYAVVALSKQSPVRVKIPDVPDIKIDSALYKTYLNQCLSNEWNYTPKQIYDQFESRFPQHKDTQRPEPGKAPNRPPVSPPLVSKRVRTKREEQSVPADNEDHQSPPKRRPIKI
jgi:hypothetical protein